MTVFQLFYYFCRDRISKQIIDTELKSKDIMAEHLIIKGETKEELYATLLPQLKSLVEGESDIIANMANISACIMDTFHFW